MFNKNQIVVSSFTFLGTILFLAFFTLSGNAQTLYSCESPEAGVAPFIHTINPNTGATLTTTEITLAGATATGCNGLARDPTTGVCWIIINTSSDQSPTPRILATIDPSTGVATSVGNTGDAFSGITFDSSGVLFGVTGDGASTPETLFTLSKSDGTLTFFQTLGNGNDGEAIAFNPDDFLMYHMSGRLSLNVPPNGKIFETINLANNAVTNIPLSSSSPDGDPTEEALALVYAGSGNFYYSDLDFNFWNVDTSGVESFIGAMDHPSKGLAFDCGVLTPPTPIPTLNEWGKIITMVVIGLFAVIGIFAMRRRSTVSS